MGAIGAVFQPELIELMKAVLDDAAAMLPEAKRTSTMKAEIASHNPRVHPLLQLRRRARGRDKFRLEAMLRPDALFLPCVNNQKEPLK